MNDLDRTDTLPTLFRNTVLKHPQRVALREKDYGIWNEYTYMDYLQNTRNFCLGLRELGLQKGDKVCILGENCKEWLYADIAVQSVGAAAVGIYPTSPAPQIEYITAHSQATFLVAKDQEQTDKILEVKERLPFLKKIIVIDMKGLRRYRDEMITSFNAVCHLGQKVHEKDPELFDSFISQTSADDVAIFVYTSGTTGPPKGSMLTHHTILSMVDSLRTVLDVRESDNIVSYLPLCHVAERLFSVFLPLKAGCKVNFADSIDTVQEAVKEIAPDTFFAVPRIWEKMHSNTHLKIQNATRLKKYIAKLFLSIGWAVTLKRMKNEKINLYWRSLYALGYLLLFRKMQDQFGLLKARNMISGGAPISPDVLKFFFSIGLKIREVYGMTETSGVTHLNPANKIKIGTVGLPVPRVECKIAEEDGEILIKAPSNFIGYYRDEVATQSVFEDGWLHTGDIGEIDEEGYLKITDRKKDLIITAGGKNITPSEIENKLKFSPYISHAVVIGDAKPFLSALIQIETENVGLWAQRNMIPYTTFKDLSAKHEVYELIQGEVDHVNKELSRVENIRKFILLTKELDHDDDELTATQKVRRKMILEKYKHLIDQIYGSRQA